MLNTEERDLGGPVNTPPACWRESPGIHRRPRRFSKILFQQKQCQFELKSRERKKYIRPADPQNPAGKKQAYKTAQLQMPSYIEGKKWKVIQRTELWSEGGALKHRRLLPSLGRF
jgi:hypothetical protein